VAVSEPIRVLYSFPHALGASGIGTTAFQQVASLATLGHDVTVWCASLARPAPPGVQVVETLRVAGVRIPHRVLGPERAYRYHDWRVGQAIRRGRVSADVVHTWPLGALSTLRAARDVGMAGVREVPNTHTAHAVERVGRELERLGLPPRPGHSHTASAARLGREEAEYAAADALLVPSEHVWQTFVDRGVGPERLHRTRYGYDPSRFGLRAAEPAERPFVAVFAGRCEPRKGLHTALRAWHRSGAARVGRLVICGTFEEDYRQLLRPDLDDPSIEVLDHVEDLGAVLRQAHVLLLPSVEEGSALVTYEAVASGAVPLVSSASGAPCQDGVDALIHEPGDVDALAGHLRSLIDHPDRLAELAAAGRARRDDLTWVRGTAQVAAGYRLAIERRRSERQPVPSRSTT